MIGVDFAVRHLQSVNVNLMFLESMISTYRWLLRKCHKCKKRMILSDIIDCETGYHYHYNCFFSIFDEKLINCPNLTDC